MMDEDAGFGYRLDSYAKFTGGVGKAARTEMSELLQTHFAKLKGSLSGSSPSERLALQMFGEVNHQFNMWCGFLTNYHIELVHECLYKQAVAWKFLGVCTRAIFGYLHKPRLEVAALQDLTDVNIKARIIWAIMQVHIRFNELLEVGFKAHPVLTRAMSSYIMKNRVDGSQMDALDKRVSVAETLAKATAADLKVLRKHKALG